MASNKQQRMMVSSLITSLLFFVSSVAYAETLTSSSFQIENPTISVGGGSASSASFQYSGALGEYMIGEASGGTFTDTTGFAYHGTTTTPTPPPVPGGGGGGGGGSGIVTGATTNVVISGTAYPSSTVNFLKDGQIVLTLIAATDGTFSGVLGGLSAGLYTLSLFAEDSLGIASAPVSLPVTLSAQTITQIGQVFIPPSVSSDKTDVKKGELFVVSGQSLPSREVTITMKGPSGASTTIRKTTNATGFYTASFDSASFVVGSYTFSVTVNLPGITIPPSKTLTVTIGKETIPTKLPQKKFLKGDLNSDLRVNLVDFSIGAYWYKKTLTPAFRAIEIDRLNGDGSVTLADFSIMAFYWTG